MVPVLVDLGFEILGVYHLTHHGKEDLVDGDRAATTTLVALSCKNLVILTAKPHSMTSPGVEVVGHGDGAASALALSDTPILVECGGSLN